MNQGDYSKRTVNLILVFVVVFIAAILWLYYKTGGEPSVTVGCVFAFVTNELWALALIKRSKIDRDNRGGE